MASKLGAPAGEAPPTHCPICLEAWDAEDHLPKFLSCHHSVCVSCVGLLHQAALKHAPAPCTPTSPTTPTSPLARLMGSRSSLNDPEESGISCWVKCPLCRSDTLVLDPLVLQTNFYLRGLLRSHALPRLVLWCDTCCCVAAPSCVRHQLRPLQDKMRRLQEELIATAGEACGLACGRVAEYERQVEVYRWACRVLRHAHARVLTALTHAQQQHRAFNHYNKDILQLVNRGEALQGTHDTEEEAISGLENVVKEVKEKQEKMCVEKEPPTLKESFQVSGSHKGPHGYHRAVLVLEADDSLTLSLQGEDELEPQDTDSTKEDATDIIQSKPFLSLQSRYKKTVTHGKVQVTKSASLREARGGSSVKEELRSAVGLDKETRCPSQSSTNPSSDSSAQTSHSLGFRQPKTSISDPTNVYEPEHPINDPLTQVASSNSLALPKKLPPATPSRDATYSDTPSPIHSDAHYITADTRHRSSQGDHMRHQQVRSRAAPPRYGRQRSRRSRRRAGKPRCSIM